MIQNDKNNLDFFTDSYKNNFNFEIGITKKFLPNNTGERKSYTTSEGGAVGEPVFAPKSKDSKDGEGWLIATEYNAAENRSNLIFLDAQHVDDGPVATAQLPHRVPYGFHGWYENRS